MYYYKLKNQNSSYTMFTDQDPNYTIFINQDPHFLKEIIKKKIEEPSAKHLPNCTFYS